MTDTENFLCSNTDTEVLQVVEHRFAEQVWLEFALFPQNYCKISLVRVILYMRKKCAENY